MASGLINTTLAKGTKAKLKRVDKFRNDKDIRVWKDPQPYPDTETWRKAMGERLKYTANDLRTNLEACLIAPRYEGPIPIPAVVSPCSLCTGLARFPALTWMGGRSQ